MTNKQDKLKKEILGEFEKKFIEEDWWDNPWKYLRPDIKDFISHTIAQARADERKKLLEEITEVRDLKPEEKGKSLDYWEGYTAAILNLKR